MKSPKDRMARGSVLVRVCAMCSTKIKENEIRCPNCKSRVITFREQREGNYSGR